MVLYVGLTVDLRRRFEEHCDSSEKNATTTNGRVIWFSWLETKNIDKVERGWMTLHMAHEGLKPPLNKVFSPVSA